MKRLLLVGLIVGIAAVGTVQANTIGPITYTWTGSELTQSDRLYRDGVASTCASPGSYPGTIAGPDGYVLFPFVNTSASAACVTVTWTGDSGFNTFLSAYLSPYDPLDLATNYLGDSGSSADLNPLSFSFLVPGDAAFYVLANTVRGITPAIGTSFSFTIDGSVAPGVVPEPTSLLLLGTGLVGLARWRRRRP